jgi:hypothetical protein
VTATKHNRYLARVRAAQDRPSSARSSGYLHALFEFIVIKRNQPDAVIDSFALYGSPTVTGSLQLV